MEEETKFDLYAEGKGLYTIVKNKTTLWQIYFPISAKIEDNIEVLTNVIEVLKKSLENSAEKDSQKEEAGPKVES